MNLGDQEKWGLDNPTQMNSETKKKLRMLDSNYVNCNFYGGTWAQTKKWKRGRSFYECEKKGRIVGFVSKS